ncbi:MAG TPA: bifunctional diaminohydroxyphosphoribosylaminopyrimidine deaminase/5-amino-6-(5-phosphoribosylamino)uracil reductase RibD, partial [Solirubrobacteraceae bacterium]
MTQALETDRIHLARAIELAEQGRGRVSPNPLVGAVIARETTVLGEGWHSAYGHPHAEVEALAAAGDRDLTGATMYVSLEPCCHHGQTPPCTEAILAAGLTRVVVASEDPSDKASGRGLGILRDEGVEVAVCDGDLSARARTLNQPFRKHARTGRPWVLFKSAMSLDGKVATPSGDSKWISSPESRRLVHQWRTECDAVAVGIGTALTDDPRLTARDVEPGPDDRVPQPRRVIFDSTARLPLGSRLVRAAEEIPLTVVTTRAAHRADVVALEGAGAEVIVAVGENDPAQVRSALRRLGEQG